LGLHLHLPEVILVMVEAKVDRVDRTETMVVAAQAVMLALAVTAILEAETQDQAVLAEAVDSAQAAAG
jgi:hypothetical protein